MADFGGSGGYDYFNQLRGKVGELRNRRDQIQSEVMSDRISMTQLEEQIAQLQREHQRYKLECDGKDGQLRKYNDLIDTSEKALNKMIENSQRLTDSLGAALQEKRL